MFVCLILLLFSGIVFAETSIIGYSQQSSATERNNARLIVKDGSGTLHVVYYDNGIYHSFSNDGAYTWSAPVLISGNGRNPAIAVGGDGELHLVYRLGCIAAYEIVHRAYSGMWSEETIVYHSPQVSVSRPALAVDSSGDLHCVWQRSGYGVTPNSEIWYSKHTESGWSAAINISNSYGASEYPTLAIGTNDNVHVFWKDSGEDISNPKMVLYREYTVGSGWDAGYSNVSNTTGNGSYSTMDPCAIVDSKNDVHLVWKDCQTGNKEIFYKKCTAGIWDETPLNLSGTNEASDTPIISVDDSDNLSVAWAEKTDGIHYDIILRKYSSSSGDWSTATNISNTIGSDSRYPNMPTVVEQDPVCIWTEGETYSYGIICLSPDNASAVDEGGVSTPSSQAILLPNHPNPFNPATEISFKLSDNAMVSLVIRDLRGRLINTLVAGRRPAGVNHAVWYGRNNKGGTVSSGVYFSCLTIDGICDVRKMTLIR